MKTLRTLSNGRPHAWLAASLFLALCGPLWAADLDPQRVGQWPGAPQGVPQAVAVSGNYACVLVNDRTAGLQVIDVSDPANPQRVGGYAATLSLAPYTGALAVAGDCAYLTGYWGQNGAFGDDFHLEVIDISIPTQPRLIATDNLRWIYGQPDWIYGLPVSTNFAYVPDPNEVWLVDDISDPANPRRVGGYKTLASLFGFVVSGHYAYNAGAELRVIDISSPANPQEVGRLPDVSGELAISGQCAYVAGSWLEGTNRVTGLQVIDVSDPTNPQRLSRLAGLSGHVAVADHYAYVASTGDWDTEWEVIDVSDPTSPQRLTRQDTSGLANDLTVSGRYAYIADGWGRLLVIDISEPANPRGVGDYPTSGPAVQVQDVALLGNCAGLLDKVARTQITHLQLIDVSDPANPRRVGAYHTDEGVTVLTLSSHYAYVAGVKGLEVIDISDHASPRTVGSLDADLDVGQNELAVSGRYAYLAGEQSGPNGYRAGLEIIDVSDPSAPRRVGRWAGEWLPEEYWHALVFPAMAVAGNYVYVADRGGLQVIDASTPTNPIRIGGLQATLGGGGANLAVSGKYLYLSASWYEQATDVWRFGLKVIDVSDAAHPREVGWLEGVGGPLAVLGNSFLAAGVTVIDITDPTRPQQVGSCFADGRVSGVAASGTYLHLASSNLGDLQSGEGLLVFDISVLANPQRVATCPTDQGGYRVAVSGNYACVAESREGWAWSTNVAVIDISSLVNPRRVGGWSTSSQIRDIAMSGNYAYVATARDYVQPNYVVGGGLQIVDIRNPSAPVEVSRFNTNGSVLAVAVSGRYAYLGAGWPESAWKNGLLVVDVSDPTHPQRVSQLECAEEQVAVSGNYAYVAGVKGSGTTGWTNWLEVIDVSDPSNPRLNGACELWEGLEEEVCGLAMSGNYAYVAADYLGLFVIDVSDPVQPQLAGTHANLSAVGVDVSGCYAYVVGGRGFWAEPGVQVLDISDPANPKRVGGNSAFTGWDLAVSGDKVYAAGDDGLIILSTYQPPPRIESVESAEDGFHLIFRGEAGRTIWLQRSPDLKTWEDWVVLTATGQSQSVADPSADSHPNQFYRAVGQ